MLVLAPPNCSGYRAFPIERFGVLKELKKVNPEAKVMFTGGLLEAQARTAFLNAGAPNFIENTSKVRTSLSKRENGSTRFRLAADGTGSIDLQVNLR